MGEYCLSDVWIGTIIGVVTGVWIVFMIFIINAVYQDDITLSQDTAQTICQKLSGNETEIEVSSINGKLVCEILSFDETQNIIIRKNSDKN